MTNKQKNNALVDYTSYQFKLHVKIHRVKQIQFQFLFCLYILLFFKDFKYMIICKFLNSRIIINSMNLYPTA